MLVLYALLLGALALFTAYTRNFQRSIVGVAAALDSAQGAALAPKVQVVRTVGLLLAWPAALGLGMLFVAWWKAAALVVAAFVVLVPVLGALTPRAMSAHYVHAIRADVERRLAAGAPDAERLRRLLEHLDRLSAPSD